MIKESESDTEKLVPDDNDDQIPVNSHLDVMKRIGSGIFYGVASFLLTVVNKTVLTSWHFPSFLILSIGQLAAAIFVLYLGNYFRIISIGKFNRNMPKRIMPLPLFHLGNMVTGLGATQTISLPMFTALRRFSILLTMILEFRILGVRPSISVQISVWCMIGGAIIAAVDDLSFSIIGYAYVMVANCMTAAYGVYIKEKLDTIDIGKYGIMFYNSLLMIIPAIILAWLTGDLVAAYTFLHWKNPAFLSQFLCSCFMGFVLTYSTFLCTQYNSALTTAMLGCFKNVFVSYVGMYIGGDYIFTYLNWIGINISILGSIYYTYIIFYENRRKHVTQNTQQV